MNHRNKILGAVSVLALLAGTHSPAGAAVNTAEKAAGSSQYTSADLGRQSDPLFDFIVAAKAGETADGAVYGIFGKASRDQIEKFPEFLDGVGTLGLKSEDVESSKLALIEIASASSALDENARTLVVAQLEQRRCTPELAAAGKCRLREPETTGAIDQDSSLGGLYGP